MVSGAPNEARHFVLHDRAVPACLRVSRALRLPLWGRESTPLEPDQHLVMVLSSATEARHVVHAVRRGAERPPSLVVAWGLPERNVAALLHERVAVVDGSIIADPAPAHAALDGAWDDARFSEELVLAEALAEMEAHLVGTGVEGS
jgi:hypothetical protein